MEKFLPHLAEIPNALDNVCYGALYRVSNENELLNYVAGVEVLPANVCIGVLIKNSPQIQ